MNTKYLASIAFGAFVLHAPFSTHAAAFLDASSLAQSEIFALEPRFQSVGEVRVQIGGQLLELGSGVLIAPDWVLTAAHVVRAIQNSTTIESYRFSLGHDASTPNDEALGGQLFVHPSFTGAITTSPDLGLIHLATPISSVTPAIRFRGVDPTPQSAPGGPLYFMAGYGSPGLLGGALPNDTIKRAGSNIVEQFGIDSTHMVSRFSPSSPSFLEWSATPGDSGGGWFMDVGSESQLAAILDWGSNPYSDGGGSGATRLSLYNDWIDTTMQSAPEPSSALLLISGAAFCLGRRSLRTNERRA